MRAAASTAAGLDIALTAPPISAASRVLSHITDSKSHTVNFAVGQESKWTLSPNGLFGAEVRKNLGPDE